MLLTAVNVLHWYRASWNGHSCGSNSKGGSLSLLFVLSALLCLEWPSWEPAGQQESAEHLDVWRFWYESFYSIVMCHRNSIRTLNTGFCNRFGEWFTTLRLSWEFTCWLSQDSTEAPALWEEMNYPFLLCFLSEEKGVLLVKTGQHVISVCKQDYKELPKLSEMRWMTSDRAVEKEGLRRKDELESFIMKENYLVQYVTIHP